MDRITDKKLVEDFLEGDEGAFESIVGTYFKAVFGFLYQITSDRSLSEDLTQETFLKAWKNMKRFDTERSLKTWLFTIAKNTAFDYLKKKKEISFSMFQDDEGNSFLENVESDEMLPDEILEREDMPKDLEKALLGLPPKHRVILNLHYKEDLTFAQIADVLGESVNTVKSRHLRAIKSLKQAIKP